jgi:hypothetical protein
MNLLYYVWGDSSSRESKDHPAEESCSIILFAVSNEAASLGVTSLAEDSTLQLNRDPHIRPRKIEFPSTMLMESKFPSGSQAITVIKTPGVCFKESGKLVFERADRLRSFAFGCGM